MVEEEWRKDEGFRKRSKRPIRYQLKISHHSQLHTSYRTKEHDLASLRMDRSPSPHLSKPGALNPGPVGRHVPRPPPAITTASLHYSNVIRRTLEPALKRTPQLSLILVMRSITILVHGNVHRDPHLKYLVQRKMCSGTAFGLCITCRFKTCSYFNAVSFAIPCRTPPTHRLGRISCSISCRAQILGPSSKCRHSGRS